MILGGSGYIIPVIRKAQELGLYVITCDYLPDNCAHKFSDEYCNVSVTDKEAVLDAARRLDIDGIISFACDPGVVTAAYVAEKMGLPFQGPYESVRILQDKGLFKKFLKENGFNTPLAKSYSDRNEACKDAGLFAWPVIVKPVDSAGSKGVMKADTPDELEAAIDNALSGSRSGSFIIEEFLTFDGYHSDADVFTEDGKLTFITYSDELFDTKASNTFTPAWTVWPGSMKTAFREDLTRQIQSLMDLLHMRTGIYNVETCVADDGKAYIMEISPRGGGGKLAEVIEMTMGPKLIENEIRKAVGMPLVPFEEHDIDGHWCEMVVFSKEGQSGILKRIEIDEEIRTKHLVLEDIFVKPGDEVHPFTGANMALGIIFLKFNTREELDRIAGSSDKWLHVILE